jgi:hypothetical protein
MWAFVTSIVSAMCFAVYIPLFIMAIRHLTNGEVKIRRGIEGGVEIKKITGYRATIYAVGQFLMWFPAAYGAFMAIRSVNLGFLFIGVAFSFAVGYVNALIAQQMKGEITTMTFDQLGFKFNLQNFAKRNFNMPSDDAPEKPKNSPDNLDIEDAVFYDVAEDEKRKNDEDINL